MNILLTNDDGIFAEGLMALHKEISKIAQVTVVAPDSERSSVGHAITLSHPVSARVIKKNNKVFGHALTGTPADCVKFATSVVLKKKPDMVISGINLGRNDGCSVFYSGTIAGAREGAMMGIPSVAVSLATFENPDFKPAAQFCRKFITKIKGRKFPQSTVLNLNIPSVPAGKIKGVLMARQGTEPIHGIFKKRRNPNDKEYFWLTGKHPAYTKDLNIDTYALNSGYVTVTPLHCDMTDFALLEEMRGWKL